MCCVAIVSQNAMLSYCDNSYSVLHTFTINQSRPYTLFPARNILRRVYASTSEESRPCCTHTQPPIQLYNHHPKYNWLSTLNHWLLRQRFFLLVDSYVKILNICSTLNVQTRNVLTYRTGELARHICQCVCILSYTHNGL